MGSDRIFANINHISLIPFVDLDGSRASIPDIAQNIIFFVPFGFLGRFSLRNRNRAIFVTVLLGGMLSLSVEILQLITTDRISSITDLITNVTGTLLGIWFYLFVMHIMKAVLFDSQMRSFLYSKRLFPVVVFFIVIVLHAMHPFNFSFDIGSFFQKIKLILTDNSYLDLLIKGELIILFHFIIFSFFVTVLLKEENIKNYKLYGFLLCISIGIALEMSQLIVISRMPGIQDILIVLTGSLIGNILAVKRLKRVSSKNKCILILVIVCLCAFTYFSYPYKITGEPESFNWFPFLAHYNKNFFTGISNYIEIFLLFFTMGFFIQYYNLFNNNNRIFIFFITSGISGCFEYLQIWIPNRYPDITDVISSLTGGILGAVCAGEGWSYFNDYLQRTRMNIKSFHRVQN
jgi:glycopeptide antibiotics resistance protein